MNPGLFYSGNLKAEGALALLCRSGLDAFSIESIFCDSPSCLQQVGHFSHRRICPTLVTSEKQVKTIVSSTRVCSFGWSH